jgi:hypothetical protein
MKSTELMAAVFGVVVTIGDGSGGIEVITLPDHQKNGTCTEMGPFNHDGRWGDSAAPGFVVRSGERLALMFVAPPPGGDGIYIRVSSCGGGACRPGDACS